MFINISYRLYAVSGGICYTNIYSERQLRSTDAMRKDGVTMKKKTI
ncbi:hypothetical protein ROSINTL182_08622 [Roseburia intestinalis L1-82]|uniref:Uncharacterized protein n=1 Tax=Roseburia intestinalis L1-82 TaxID=536231 RepID=C7GFB7_9FIRM|nr:hypothetical protein ROSINTL182_08622 [Roseburia intestinalis L1-82]